MTDTINDVDAAHDVLGLHGVGPVLSREAAAVERAVLTAGTEAQRNGEVHEAFVVAALVLLYDVLGDRAGSAMHRMVQAAQAGAMLYSAGMRR